MCAFKAQPKLVIGPTILLIESRAIQNQGSTEQVVASHEVIDAVEDDGTAATECRELVIRAQCPGLESGAISQSADGVRKPRRDCTEVVEGSRLKVSFCALMTSF